MLYDKRHTIVRILTWVIFLMLVLIALILDSQAIERADHCQLPFAVEDSTDLTEPMLGAYREYSQNGYSDQWFEYVDTIYEAAGGAYRPIAFYDFEGRWGILYYTRNHQLLVMLGDEWALGDDNQLHSPSCLMLLPLSTFYEMTPYFVTTDIWTFLEYAETNHDTAH